MFSDNRDDKRQSEKMHSLVESARVVGSGAKSAVSDCTLFKMS